MTFRNIMFLETSFLSISRFARLNITEVTNLLASTDIAQRNGCANAGTRITSAIF
jgi:hypothetical protein